LEDKIMFVCYDCEAVFDEPKIWTETHGLDTPPYEHCAGCPSCGGAFTETYECSYCNKWITGQYVKLNNGDRICDGCYVQMELGDED
jgi:hypothetical protein